MRKPHFDAQHCHVSSIKLIVCLIADQNLIMLCCLLAHMSRLRSIIGTFYTTDSIFNLIKKTKYTLSM